MTLHRRVTQEPLLMTLDSAAWRYDVSRSTVERWCRDGKLRAIKIGGSVRLNIMDSDQALGALPTSAPAQSGAASGAGGRWKMPNSTK